MCAATETALRSDEGRAVVGPFGVLGGRFVVESQDRDLLARVAAGYADLAVDGAASDATVYRVEQTGPAWNAHCWTIWRDGELISDEALGDFLPTLIPSDFARHVLADTPTTVAIDGVAVARDGQAIVLTGDVETQDAYTGEEPADLMALAARAAQMGWALVALDVVPVATASGLQVQAFHRPFDVEPDASLAALVGGGTGRRLVPASAVGSLARASVVSAVIAVRRGGRGAASLEPTSPPAMLRALAARLPGGPERRRLAFGRLAHLVRQVPCAALEVGDDLDLVITMLDGDR